MSDLAYDEQHSGMDAASVRMLDLPLDRLERLAEVVPDSDRDAYDGHDDEAYER